MSLRGQAAAQLRVVMAFRLANRGCVPPAGILFVPV